jgi:hypothetical protein
VIAKAFVVVFPSDHRLAAHDAVELRDIVGETFIIPSKTAPTSRVVIEDYLKRSGLDITPDHEVSVGGGTPRSRLPADTYLPAFGPQMPAARPLTPPPLRIPPRHGTRSPVWGIA